MIDQHAVQGGLFFPLKPTAFPKLLLDASIPSPTPYYLQPTFEESPKDHELG